MTMKIRFQYTGMTPKAPQRTINAATREAYQALGEEFFDKNLPRRFTVFGAKLLGYEPRTQKHQERKRKRFGHNDPLVFTGETRARVLDEGLTKIQAFATRNRSHVALTLNAPALNFRANSNAPDMRDEITRVSTRELPPLERFLERELERRYQQLEKA